MSVLVSDVKQGVEDRYGQVATAKFNRYLAKAVRLYSEWNPRILETSVTTVADTTVYSLASVSNLIGIKEVRYFPGSYLSTGTRLVDEETYTSSMGPERYHLWSHRIIEDIEEGERADSLRETAYYRKATNELKLANAPSAGDTVTIFYYAAHVLSSTTYSTIPSEDLDIIVGLTLAEYYEDRAWEMALQPDYREGQESETFNKMSANILSIADRARAMLQTKYSASVAIN